MALPKYRGDETCPKDGVTQPARTFHEQASCPLEPTSHLHLTCGVCHYEWAVAPADAV